MNDGGKAFPSFERLTMLRRTDVTPEQKETIYFESQGMSLRDYFAAKAMQGVLANPESVFTPSAQQKKEGITWAMICASECFEIADAMLAERNKHE